jgi:hypothetical protein
MMREATHASCKELDPPRQRIISMVVIGGSDHPKTIAGGSEPWVQSATVRTEYRRPQAGNYLHLDPQPAPIRPNRQDLAWQRQRERLQ